MRPFRCVKCGEGHKTAECPKKDRNTPAKCALCSCDHPANYKGCQVYKEILARKTIRPGPNHTTSSEQKSKTSPLEFDSNSRPKQPISSNKCGNRSYSDVTSSHRNTDRADNSDPLLSQQSSIEAILTKQTEKIDSLLQQIGTLINLLTTVISKMNSK